MDDILTSAIEHSRTALLVFAKTLAPNDTGLTGGHQCGIYIPKTSTDLIFDAPFSKGDNHERWSDIVWNDGLVTHSRFVYYGKGTRNEYRITHFGRGFEWLGVEHTGDLFIICKASADLYYAYLLSTEEDIEAYLDAFSLPPTQLNRIVSHIETEAPDESRVFETYLLEFGNDFPSTSVMALSAEEADRVLSGDTVKLSPDETLVRWIDVEYRLFRQVEQRHYDYVTFEPADSLDHFISTGLEIANRRKARAGKSLEHHLAAIFDQFGIRYTSQARTEGKKKPDFLFPSESSYHDPGFPASRLTFLGAKTTCKDRWRQVLNEADRIEEKYLFTLQQSMSPGQLAEMHAERLILVVPAEYHRNYPKTEWTSVITLQEFIDIVLNKQSLG